MSARNTKMMALKRGSSRLLFAGLLALITQSSTQICLNGFQCLSCSQAQICVGGIPSGTPLTCPTGTFCLNTNPFECTFGTCPTSFTCVIQGRFPDPANPNNYYICITDAAAPNGLLQISVTCPTGSTFSPTQLQCVLITTTSTTTTTTPTTTTASTTTTATPPIYSCTTVGRYPSTTNCSIYYMCSLNPSGGFYVYQYTCPATTQFNAATQKCVKAASSGCSISG